MVFGYLPGRPRRTRFVGHAPWHVFGETPAGVVWCCLVFVHPRIRLLVMCELCLRCRHKTIARPPLTAQRGAWPPPLLHGGCEPRATIATMQIHAPTTSPRTSDVIATTTHVDIWLLRLMREPPAQCVRKPRLGTRGHTRKCPSANNIGDNRSLAACETRAGIVTVHPAASGRRASFCTARTQRCNLRSGLP